MTHWDPSKRERQPVRRMVLQTLVGFRMQHLLGRQMDRVAPGVAVSVVVVAELAAVVANRDAEVGRMERFHIRGMGHRLALAEQQKPAEH